ncbi:hypothetical protein [Bradyrhizobium liaoningense]
MVIGSGKYVYAYLGGGRIEVAALDPVASMQAIDNPHLKQDAERVQAKLKKAIGTLGMARRAVLARALAVAPDILVLDQPFASLDSHLVTALAGVVRARADMGTPVLLVTHELDQAPAVADHILVLSGQPATLATNLPVPAWTNPAAVASLRADLLARFPFLGRASDHVHVQLTPTSPPNGRHSYVLADMPKSRRLDSRR